MTEPRRIAHYEIGELLGRGGMGEVYRAVDTRMYRRPVALKLISEALGSDPRALSRFDLEIETAANLQHPNIVTIYDRGEYEGRRFFVMELLDGVDLSAAIKDRSIRTLEERLEIVRQLCEALDYAHRQGVVHRDIKPANIMLVRGGGADHVKLLDFGIAKVSRADRTRTVVQPGTLFYMSPEQLRDDVVDAGSDLFAVGIVAYELCCGVHPFRAKTEYLVSSNIMLQKQPPARSHDPSLPEALDALFDRLLEKERDKRPASAGEVAGELRRLLAQLRGGATDSEPHVYGKLDEMTTSMVERLVHWAKTKEAAGAYLEALEGFKRALLLAPEARWLEPPIARLEARLAEASVAQAATSDDARSTSARDRHRETFVVESLASATAAFDDGDVDRASSIIAGVMRRYPDEHRALELMDRIVLIAGRGIPVKPFRQALREASAALAAGDVAAAQKSCDAAVALWPDAEEAVTLGREIEKRRLVELSEAIQGAQEVVGRASGGDVPDERIAETLASAHEPLARAEILGAPQETLQELRGAIDRLAREAESRLAEKRKLADRAEADRRAEVARLLLDARRRIESAEKAATGDLAAARAAHDDLAGIAEPIGKALGLDSANGEARELVATGDALRKRLAAHIAGEEEAERAAVARASAVARGLGEVEALVGGGDADLARADEMLRSLAGEIESLRRERPALAPLPYLGTTYASLSEAVVTRRRVNEAERARAERIAREEEERARRERDDAERRESAARADAERKAEAERDRKEREARDEEDRARREREEVERRENAARAEAERKAKTERDRKEREEREAAELERERSARLGRSIDGARAAMDEARAQRPDLEFEADRVLAVLDRAAALVGEALDIEPKHAAGVKLSSEIAALRDEAAPLAAGAPRRRERAEIGKAVAEAKALAKGGRRKEALRAFRTLEARSRRHPDWSELAEPVAPLVKRWEDEAAAGRSRLIKIAGAIGGIVVLVVVGVFVFKPVQEHQEQLRAARQKADGLTQQAKTDVDGIEAELSRIQDKATTSDKVRLEAERQHVAANLGEASTLDPDNRTARDLESRVATLGSTIQQLNVGITPPSPPPIPPGPGPVVSDPGSTIKDLESDLASTRIGPDASLRDLRVALDAAETGAKKASSAKKQYPGNTRVVALERDLGTAATDLAKRRDEIESKLGRDLADAQARLHQAESGMNTAKTESDREKAKEACDAAGKLVAQVLRQDSGNAAAVETQKGVDRLSRSIREWKPGLPPTPPPPTPPPPGASGQKKFEDAIAKANACSVTDTAGLRDRVASFGDALAAAGNRDDKAKAERGRDDAGIRLALYQLARLYATRDARQIRTVWPSYPAPQGLGDWSLFKLTFQRIDVDLGATTATVDQTITQNLGKGKDIVSSQKAEYRFDRSGDAWVIVGFRLVR